MGFQIKNKEGEAITIKELDKEAAEFWGKEVHPKWYANPVKPRDGESSIDTMRREMSTNWFDCIGYQIHKPSNEDYQGWDGVKRSLWSLHSSNWYNKIMVWSEEEALIYLAVVKEHIQPYYELIDYWQSKGYEPYKVED